MEHLGEFGGCKVRMIHPLGSLMSHDCCPNVIRYVSGVKHGNYLQCRASTDISKGQTLTISYINPITPTQMRQIILKKVNFLKKIENCNSIPIF